jgi:hypothetical protein
MKGFVGDFLMHDFILPFIFGNIIPLLLISPFLFFMKRVMHGSMEEMMRSSGDAIKLQLLCHNVL